MEFRGTRIWKTKIRPSQRERVKMSSRKDKDNEKKLMNEYCQRKLTKMLQDDDNKYCVDCDAKGKLSRSRHFACVCIQHSHSLSFSLLKLSTF